MRHFFVALALCAVESSAAPPSYGECQWSVFYNNWLPSFDPGEYEHPGEQGGAHCLAACCEDPTCKGIQLMSDELYQCYKYSSLPSEVNSQAALESARMLGNGRWLGQLRPAWSVFVKNSAANAPQPQKPDNDSHEAKQWSKFLESSWSDPNPNAAPVAASQALAASEPPGEFALAVAKASKSIEEGFGMSAQSISDSDPKCGWDVHYNLWLDTFARGEYEPPNDYGGAHCLLACCQDPTCEGLALMSNEEYQCYKYKGLPTAVASHQGTSLGDGKWLKQKAPAWSIFVKTLIQSPAAPRRVVEPALPEAILPAVLPGLSWQRPQKLRPHGGVAGPGITVATEVIGSGLHMAILLSIIGAVALLTVRLAVPDALPMLARRIDGLQGGPETAKLLQSEGIDMNNLTDDLGLTKRYTK